MILRLCQNFFWLILYSLPLAANWSSPPVVIYPSSSPYYAATPSIATGGHGLTVAVWFDVTGTGSLLAATLSATATNNQGQPNWVLTSPVKSSNVRASYQPYAQMVGVDGNGNALAVWVDDLHNVLVSTLPYGQTTWTRPVIINTQLSSEVVNFPNLAVAPNGNALAVWTSSPSPYVYHVLANSYDSTSQTWRGQQELLGGGTILDSELNQVATDSQGNGTLVISSASTNIQLVTYNFNDNAWTTIPPIVTSSSSNAAISVDPAGNTTVVWLEDDGSMNAASLPFGQTSFIKLTTLSTTAAHYYTLPQVVSDAQGNAVAAWPDISGALASARFSFSDMSWSVLPNLNLSGNLPGLISLSGDAAGDALATWLIYVLGSGSYVQAASLAAGSTTWSNLAQLSPNTEYDSVIHGVITSTNNGVAIWENDINDTGFTGEIESSLFLSLFGVSPPSYFAGKFKEFVLFTTIYQTYMLKWGASPDINVTEYRLYKNDVLIDTIPAGQTSYRLNVNEINQWRPITFKLTAANSQGMESDPLSVKLPRGPKAHKKCPYL